MVSVRITIEDDSELYNIAPKVLQSLKDTNVGVEIHNTLARYCYPYVPMDTGTLFTSTEVTNNYLRYNTPYAHYMYVGKVYGPNIPIIENGQIVGWFSIPNKKKSPTGKSINYSTSKHPLATHHWDKAMMQDRAEDFSSEVGDIIERRIHHER